MERVGGKEGRKQKMKKQEGEWVVNVGEIHHQECKYNCVQLVAIFITVYSVQHEMECR